MVALSIAAWFKYKNSTMLSLRLIIKLREKRKEQKLNLSLNKINRKARNYSGFFVCVNILIRSLYRNN